MISVNTGLTENGGFQTTEPIQHPTSAHTNFNLQDVLASQAPGHNAITAGINKDEAIYGGWTHLLGYSGNAQDVANAANANYAAEHSASRITAAQVTAQGSAPSTNLSFWERLKAQLFGAAQRAGH